MKTLTALLSAILLTIIAVPVSIAQSKIYSNDNMRPQYDRHDDRHGRDTMTGGRDTIMIVATTVTATGLTMASNPNTAMRPTVNRTAIVTTTAMTDTTVATL